MALGRSNDLSSFVKKGKEEEESFVEVDLLNKESVTNIRRNIYSGNRGKPMDDIGKSV